MEKYHVTTGNFTPLRRYLSIFLGHSKKKILTTTPAQRYTVFMALLCLVCAAMDIYRSLLPCCYIMASLALIMILSLLLRQATYQDNVVLIAFLLFSTGIFALSSVSGIHAGLYTYQLTVLMSFPILCRSKSITRMVILNGYIILLVIVHIWTDITLLSSREWSYTHLQERIFTTAFIEVLIIACVSGIYLIKQAQSAGAGRRTQTVIIDKHAATPQQMLPPTQGHDVDRLTELALDNSPALVVQFNQYFPHLYPKLLAVNPQITALEFKTLIYIKLGFSTKEIAQLAAISVRTVETRKNRIRKNFNLRPNTNLYTWLKSFAD